MPQAIVLFHSNDSNHLDLVTRSEKWCRQHKHMTTHCVHIISSNCSEYTKIKSKVIFFILNYIEGLCSGDHLTYAKNKPSIEVSVLMQRVQVRITHTPWQLTILEHITALIFCDIGHIILIIFSVKIGNRNYEVFVLKCVH